jgi:hypothetical protein
VHAAHVAFDVWPTDTLYVPAAHDAYCDRPVAPHHVPAGHTVSFACCRLGQ